MGKGVGAGRAPAVQRRMETVGTPGGATGGPSLLILCDAEGGVLGGEEGAGDEEFCFGFGG